MHLQTLKDVMTSNPETLTRDASIREAAQLLRDIDVGIVPIIDHERLVGVVTDRDICVRGVADGIDYNADVARIMTTEVITCAPEASIDEAVDLMSQYEVRRMLVVDERRQLCGVVALADLARYASGEQAEEVVRNTSQ
jgi:CBS domain-containing protein